MNLLFKQYGVAALVWFSLWCLGAALGTYTGFLLGVVAGWAYLAEFEALSRMYWHRLIEPKILLFLGILAVTHAIPGFVVFSVFPDYFVFFAMIASVHIGAEILIICSRKPKQ